MKILKTIAPIISLTLITVLAQGCVRMELEVNEYGVGSGAEQLVDGTPEAVGVLALLNHPQTSAVMLDVSVQLDVRAAEAIIEVRDGEDGRPQTDDDYQYLSIDEVDSVSWVGPAAMNSLQYYVINYGWVPLGDESLGTWDDVAFTVDEAELVLQLANTGSVEHLDQEVRLDSRAVESIVAARPLQTVLELSELWYVGESALDGMKLYVLDDSPDDGVLCEPMIQLIEDSRIDGMNDMFRQLDVKTDRVSLFQSFRIVGCDGFIGDSELEQLVAAEISESASIVEVDQLGEFADGIDSFESLLMSAVQRSSEEQLDGDRTGEDSAELLESTASQFVTDLERGPYQLLEVWMYGHDGNCVEELVGALEAESSRLVVFSASKACL